MFQIKAPEPIVWCTKIVYQEFKSEVLSFREIHQQRKDLFLWFIFRATLTNYDTRTCNSRKKCKIILSVLCDTFWTYLSSFDSFLGLLTLFSIWASYANFSKAWQYLENFIKNFSILLMDVPGRISRNQNRRNYAVNWILQILISDYHRAMLLLGFYSQFWINFIALDFSVLDLSDGSRIAEDNVELQWNRGMLRFALVALFGRLWILVLHCVRTICKITIWLAARDSNTTQHSTVYGTTSTHRNTS